MEANTNKKETMAYVWRKITRVKTIPTETIGGTCQRQVGRPWVIKDEPHLHLPLLPTGHRSHHLKFLVLLRHGIREFTQRLLVIDVGAVACPATRLYEAVINHPEIQLAFEDGAAH
jgi:hypothetical protein